MQEKLKICVYAIAKNEAKFVDRWMDAVGEADSVIVLDTGSDDDTADRLRARGAKVYEQVITPWRFDTARNIAMSYIPEDTDICVSNDLDEVFVPGWRKLLESAWTKDCTRAKYMFTYEFKTDGTPKKQFSMEKIHARRHFKWVHPVHEVLEYSGDIPDKSVFVPGLILNHYPDSGKSRGQYLPLLELSAAENPNDDRVIFWLGREYMFNNRNNEAIFTLKQYLGMPTAVWDEERSAAMRFIANCYARENDFAMARRWHYRAVAECPGVREPYLAAARFAYNQKDWALCALMSGEVLKITVKTNSYLLEPEAWNYEPYDLASISNYWLKNYKLSYEYALAALKFQPENARLKKNSEIVYNKLY